MRALYLILFLLLSFSAFSQDTLVYTGDTQTYIVPPCVYLLDVEVVGASGFAAAYPSSVGGLGGKVTGSMRVRPGQILQIFVGGAGTMDTVGWNGGGTNGLGTGSTGGGASDIRTTNSLQSRLVVAGGGGGAGSTYQVNNNGGAGGGFEGMAGQWNNAYNASYCGLGGTQSAGGKGAGGTARNGSLGKGGDSGGNGGGGGGGYYGGGAGTGATTCCTGGGGGGGSSYTHPSVFDVTHEPGVRDGDGYIVITPNASVIPPLYKVFGDSLICEGKSTSFSVDSFENTTYYWDFPEGTSIDSGENNSRIFVTTGPVGGEISVYMENTCGTSDPRVDSFVVSPKIEAIITPRDTIICIDDLIQVFVKGAFVTAWTPQLGLGCSSCNNPLAAPRITTTYYATLIDSAEVCESTIDSMIIRVDSCKEDTVVLPPNGIKTSALNLDLRWLEWNRTLEIGSLSSSGKVMVELIGMNGAKLWTSSLTPLSGKAILNLPTSLESGLYILRIQQDQRQEHLKLLISN